MGEKKWGVSTRSVLPGLVVEFINWPHISHSICLQKRSCFVMISMHRISFVWLTAFQKRSDTLSLKRSSLTVNRVGFTYQFLVFYFGHWIPLSVIVHCSSACIHLFQSVNWLPVDEAEVYPCNSLPLKGHSFIYQKTQCQPKCIHRVCLKWLRVTFDVLTYKCIWQDTCFF